MTQSLKSSWSVTILILKCTDLYAPQDGQVMAAAPVFKEGKELQALTVLKLHVVAQLHFKILLQCHLVLGLLNNWNQFLVVLLVVLRSGAHPEEYLKRHIRSLSHVYNQRVIVVLGLDDNVGAIRVEVGDGLTVGGQKLGSPTAPRKVPDSQLAIFI